MRLISKVLLVFLLLLSFTLSTNAQIEKLFAPYDCRMHAEILLDNIITDTISSVSTEALTVIEAEPEIIFDTVDVWQKWETVSNYTYGKDRGGMPMITELNALHPYFRDRVLQLINTCKAQGIELAVVESYRTHAKQHEYKTMGKKYTRSGAGKSKHQYGLAVDLVPIIDSVAVWHNIVLWKKIGVIGEKLGLRWGGRWRHPFDPGHFEWTGGITTTDLAKGKLPVITNQEIKYPCLEEDVNLLRQYWKEWEVAQSSFARK